MKIGDMVRVVRIPDHLIDDEVLNTKGIFALCVGRVFSITGIVEVQESNNQLFELEVGEVLGEFASKHSIWIESDLVEPANHSN